MKTQEQKLQHVMEATGECWHEFPQQGLVGKTDGGHNIYCEKGCMIFVADGTKYHHPSPDDLNELFRLAEKTGYKVIEFYCEDPTSDLCCIRHCEHEAEFEAKSFTPAEALLNALFIATGGKE